MLEQEISSFKAKHPDIKVLNGGDGCLVADWEYDKKLLPVRNYGLCDKHEAFYQEVLENNDLDLLRNFCYPTICVSKNNAACKEALAEIVLRNKDLTSCLRFNVYINNKLANANVIADGILLASNLGSTGYFKSVARTIFRHGLGLAFLNPTYSIPNLVLALDDEVDIEVLRSTEIQLAWDKKLLDEKVQKNDVFHLQATRRHVTILGYDAFMCETCRRNRNSTVVNDSYMIV